jgi:hypothetical protein
MNSVRALGVAVVIATSSLVSATALTGCGGDEVKSAHITPGPMPEGESWTGVYFHPVFGYLHMVEEGSNVVGRWKRTDGSAWGELSGTENGNVMHFTWKEHTYGLVGPAAERKGRGYFVYKVSKREGEAPELDGEYGNDESEVGSTWHNVKQTRMTPDLKSIGGAAPEETVRPGGLD